MTIQKLFSLQGKRALITGSSRGIGRAIAKSFSEAGAEVIVHGSRSSAQLDSIAEELHAEKRTANLGNLDEVADLIKNCSAPDILVMNASMQSYIEVQDFNYEEFEKEYRVNLAANFEFIKAWVPSMQQKKWGRLLAIGSINGIRPAARLSIYGTTKAAFANLIYNCAKQYSHYGITANTIIPGVITTDRNTEILKNKEIVHKLLDIIPAHTFGNAEDITGAALLLCSNAGRYITGANINITGGMEL
ncbi:MAG: SDR family oxidoreductase [Lentisphaeria bacterium]